MRSVLNSLAMNQLSINEVFRRRLGFVPGAIAVMGKWEPYLSMSRCLEEVGARAAAALAMGEALQPAGPGPLLLSVEGQLRGQPRPGCLLCAEVLVSLGATPAGSSAGPAPTARSPRCARWTSCGGERGPEGCCW